ncbi:MAG: acetyl-CoA carboxylase biotin carboxyl carrier protein [Johnsonella sp.]|nr:acetyl-CoA carboxylase biotin carboxyl carrier protein [Johnsonella sp.]
MNIEEMILLMEAVKKSGIDSFAYKNESEKIVIKRKKEEGRVFLQEGGMPIQEVQVRKEEVEIGDGCAIENEKLICSPLVGTFYAAPSPGAKPFVSVGDRVKKGQVLGIIEAMKLMNEIESEHEGVVEAILIEDETMVEFNQPLFRIR